MDIRVKIPVSHLICSLLYWSIYPLRFSTFDRDHISISGDFIATHNVRRLLFFLKKKRLVEDEDNCLLDDLCVFRT